MGTVVDLTESPQLPANTSNTATMSTASNEESSTAAAAAAASAAADVVTISSDEEDTGAINIPGTRPLPRGYVLPPIHRRSANEPPRPERISTLRELLFTRTSSRRTRRGARSGPRRGVPPPLARAPGISAALPHTGEEPVEIGVYRPIRATPLLPHERRRQWSRANIASIRQQQEEGRQQRQQQQAQQQVRQQAQQPLSHRSSPFAATLGTETTDGAIDVESVDDSRFNDEVSEFHAWARRPRPDVDLDVVDEDDYEDSDYEDERSDSYEGGRGDSTDGYGDGDEDEMYSIDDRAFFGRSSEMLMRFYMNTRLAGNPVTREQLIPRLEDFAAAGNDLGDDVAVVGEQLRQNTRAGTPSVAGTRSTRNPFIFPFHPALRSHHFQRGPGGGITPFDFFQGEDIGDLLSFLEANTPVPPSRPISPLPPLKLSKRQEELAATSEFTRQVPDANYRDAADAADAPTEESLEIVCTACEQTLYEKEPVWAATCGHVLCNPCVEAIPGASKACKACKRRIVKKSLVHLFT